MAVLTATFETGVNGNTVSTGDAGSLTAWDAVQITAPGTLTYSSARAAHGTLAAHIDPSTASSGIHMAWTTALGTVTDHYGRAYINVDAVVIMATTRQMGTLSGGSNGAQLRMINTGAIQLLDGLNAIQATSTALVVSDSWCRLEWHIIHSTTVGQIVLRIYLTPDSATFDEEVSTAANINTRANADEIRFGATMGSPTGTSGIWFDDIVANATDWPGPAVTTPVAGANLAPVIYGRGAC